MYYSVSVPYSSMNLSSPVFPTYEHTYKELLPRSWANVCINRPKTRQKLSELHFQVVSCIAKGKFKGCKLTDPHLKIWNFLAWVLQHFHRCLVVYGETDWQRWCHSTFFCRWLTEVQADLVKIALSNHVPHQLPAGIHATHYSSWSRVSRKGYVPTAWHHNMN